jgi:hypothetical protein
LEHDRIEILARVDEIVAGALAVAGISAHELARRVQKLDHAALTYSWTSPPRRSSRSMWGTL